MYLSAKYVEKRFAAAQMRKSSTCTRLDEGTKENGMERKGEEAGRGNDRGEER